jgi:hypothetical protein
MSWKHSLRYGTLDRFRSCPPVPKALAVLTLGLVLLLSGRDSSARDLRDLIPGLYGGDGITLADPPPGSPFPTHAPHFTIDSAAAINQLNDQVATEIALFPFSSSVGGFTFAFDPLLGTFVSTTETLGPLFAERAPTLGRGKLNVNVSFTYFKYDKFEGDSLDSLVVIARHQPDVIPPRDERTSFELDTIRINVDLDIRVWFLSLAATYGLTDRLDVGILVPIVHVDMDVRAQAEIVPSEENPFPGVHTFTGGPEAPVDQASGEAIGIGDIVLRGKYHLVKSDLVDVAGAILVQLATGDEDNFLGTGTTTVRPFLVLSRTFDAFPLPSLSWTPHLNVGFEFNIDRSDQSAIEYVIGFDVGSKRFVVAVELIGSHEPDGDGIGDNILNASVGLKWNPFKRFIVAGNVQVPLNYDGLRSYVIPTVEVEYSF